MALTTMTLSARFAPWMMPVLWGLVPVFLIVGERASSRIVRHIATRAIHVG